MILWLILWTNTRIWISFCIFVYDTYIKPYLSKKKKKIKAKANAKQNQDEKENDNANENENDNNDLAKTKGIESIFIVCHSAGGIATTRLLNVRKSILPYIVGVAGTDTDFGRPKSDEAKIVFKEKLINFRASYQEKGTVLSAEDEFPKKVSAGHHKHQYTNAAAMDLVFKFFKEKQNK